MKQEMFAELLDSVKEARDHAQGKRSLRTTTLPPPLGPLDGRAVKKVRSALRASQTVFAGYLNVSAKLVQAWEADRRKPEGPALVLLHLAAQQPEVIERLRDGSPSRSTHRAPRAARRRTAKR
jgi:putative transcriptional regulator